MKTFFSLCLIGGLGLGGLCQAQQQMDSDAKKKVIKDLENLLALSKSAETKIINAAISKLSSAGNDPGTAYDLMVQSKKFLMEEEKNKDRSQGKSAKSSSSSMKDWMEHEAKKYQDKNARKGLMLQYQWGVLVLKARLKENMMKASSSSSDTGEEEGIDLTEFQKPAMDLLNAYLAACSDPDFVDPSVSSSSSRNNNNKSDVGIPGIHVAGQSVLNTDVGEALGIGSLSAKDFPDSMRNIDNIFEKLFFVGYRKARNLTALRSAWSKRIAMEVTLSKVNQAISSGKKSGMAGRIANTRMDALDDKITSNLDRLRWRCEMDCFDLGDQANATNNMLAIIKSTVDPGRREQYIRGLHGKLIESMKALIPGALAREESATSGRASRPASTARPAVRPPSTTLTTSEEMDDPGAVGADAPKKPKKPDPTKDDDFFEDA